MPGNLRGPHHCVGVATSIAEMLFQYLQAKCEQAGGSLSASELKAAHAQFFASMPKVYNFFESAERTCMEASEAAAPAPLARDAILATLLMACNEKAARHAFPMQIKRFGGPWIAQFFAGFAEYVRRNVCRDADNRLIQSYMEAALRRGAELSTDDLMREASAQQVLRNCLAPFLRPDAPDALAKDVSDVASVVIAEKRGIPHPDLSKVTEQEVRNFLVWLPRLLFLALSPGAAEQKAAAG